MAEARQAQEREHLTQNAPSEARNDAPAVERRKSVFSVSLGQALRASDEILELLPIATCVCDAFGRIVQYNHRAVELWGRAPEPGQTHDHFVAQCRFFGGEGEELPHSKMAEVLKTGRAIRDEVTVVRADQTEIAVLLNIDPLLNPQGK